ncbi:glucosamine inositolphosphorylceramide transferase family protein [Shinella sedimenti]|uniref:Glucosamine inositolphosphorylceramide transferase 1 N-terminal domain-containing protein n=1 Tax=Shinella sedimenti TaxID=2919913 RepID=A0ABT0CR43_9HYPH|nr:hypothetical protein [Shinella sedimenti]MCJ8151047.1 hypothetical protein [Shinella sedimenti]
MSGRHLAIEVIVPGRCAQYWHQVLLERLAAAGHAVAVVTDEVADPWPAWVNGTLGLERRLFRRRAQALASQIEPLVSGTRHVAPNLGVDLSGNASVQDVPTLALRCDGAYDVHVLPALVAAGRLPVLEVVLDGVNVVGRAWPMIDRREAVSLGVEDVLARAITLLVSAVETFAANRLNPHEDIATDQTEHQFLPAYLTCALPRLGREAWRRLRFRQAHWRVGYRFHDGPGVVDTGRLGTGWRVLMDAGDRFYADPFVFHWQGRVFLFVEDYPHAAGKAVISVVPFSASGVPQAARVILEEPHHLSYPQVFDWEGSIWMLPEASASGKLTLYRAEDFPDRWRAEAVLVEGEISDATLLAHGGRLWLFATDRDGFGSTSDTLVIFEAEALTGPWRPHRLNPILIDRRSARPGGAFVRDCVGRLLMPVQDGTLGYGGGLGLSELLALDSDTVQFSPPIPVLTDGDWPYPRIHTLNRSGPLEVIDGIVPIRRPLRENSAS